MIHRNAVAWQGHGWRQELANAFSRIDDLFDYLELPREALPAARAAAADFPLRVPRRYADLIRKGDPGDPLLRQVLPTGAELLPADGFSTDPVGDAPVAQAPGVLHKYRHRLLLIASASCAVNCRYCFRRHYPYQQGAAGRDGWRRALTYLEKHPEIDEVILSGGDPLILSDERLAALVRQLQASGPLRRLRIHSRLPALLPTRLTDRLTTLLSDSRLQTVLVLHCNHPRELTDALANALRPLRQAGVTLLNQSVLLRGVNDCIDTLCRLSGRLFECGLLPYYLHQLDRVAGAAHFEVEQRRAIELYRQMQQRLPGYLVPRLVTDRPGEEYKRHLA